MTNDSRRRDVLGSLRDSLFGGGEQARERERLLRLLEINRALVSERQPKRLLAMILDAAIELSAAERGFLLLRGDDGRAEVEVARNLDREAIKTPEFKFSRTVVAKAMEEGVSVLTDSAAEDPSFNKAASVMGMQLRSILCAPLRLRGESIGGIYVDHRFRSGSFTESDKKILELIADQAAVAVENARLHVENDVQRGRLVELNHELEARVREQQFELEDAREQLAHLAVAPPKNDYSEIIGTSRALADVFRLLDIVCETDYPALILGESGTGKELVARAIVRHGARRDASFLVENCAAIPDSLLESELFGHVKGAFTGASSDHVGLFEQADGGTLFLDEIGDMPLPLQSKLLRVLQEGEFRKVGASRPTKVDVRIIAATNQNLAAKAREGAFREDLYYRLKVMTVKLPPLRERREDVPLLIDHFLERVAMESSQPKRKITPAALRALASYPWPGNVRELENEMRRMAALAGDGTIDSDLVRTLVERPSDTPAGALSFGAMTMDEIERKAILEAIERCGGKRSEAAKALGMPRRTFYNRLRKHGIL
jgi:transcriptional regulator with GAF, ATPase, and Fis domain